MKKLKRIFGVLFNTKHNQVHFVIEDIPIGYYMIVIIAVSVLISSLIN